MRGRPDKLRILLVDDDEVDIEIVRRSLRRCGIGHDMRIAHDGLQALAWLRGPEDRLTRHPPVVLLDINMPRMSGLELLRALRDDEALEHLVVFVLTTSDDEHDIFEAYHLNVAGYLLKTAAGDGFVEATRLIGHYWQAVGADGGD